MGRVFIEHWNIVLAVAGLLTVVATYTFRLFYQRYYDALGLGPQDVGIGPADFVAQSALGTVLFIIVGALITTAVIAPAAAAVFPALDRQATKPKLPGGHAKAVAMSRFSRDEVGEFTLLMIVALTVMVSIEPNGAMLVGVVGGIALVTAIGPGWRRTLAAAAVGAITAAWLIAPSSAWVPIVCAAAVAAASASIYDAVRAVRVRKTRLPQIIVAALWVDLPMFLALIAAAAIVFMLLIIAVLPFLGDYAASRVRTGRVVDGFAFIGVPVLDVHARPAQVRWKDKQSRPKKLDLGGCLLLLGHDNNTALIYQVKRDGLITRHNRSNPPKIKRRRLMRIPQDDALVVVGDNNQCLPAH